MRIIEHISIAMKICGIDPGVGGAFALIENEQVLAIEDMPTFMAGGKKSTRKSVNADGVSTILREWQPDHVFIELVGSRPGEGHVGAFSFGDSAGVLRGAAAALLLPVTRVPPAQWKQALKVPAAKDGARARATQLLPRAAVHWKRKMDDGRAEAALIALWGWRMGLGNRVVEW